MKTHLAFHLNWSALEHERVELKLPEGVNASSYQKRIPFDRGSHRHLSRFVDSNYESCCTLNSRIQSLLREFGQYYLIN